jgi:pimeloyl-ACP methyl ester carboxylesterase
MVLLESSHEDQAGRRLDIYGRAGGSTFFRRLALRQQARILGLHRLAAAAGRAHELDADIADMFLPEHAAAGRAIALSTRYRRVVAGEFRMMARLCGRPPGLGTIPLTVVTAGNPPYPGRVPMQEEIAALSTCSTHITAEGSGHYVPHDDPELVVSVIRDMAKRSSPRPAPRS